MRGGLCAGRYSRGGAKLKPRYSCRQRQELILHLSTRIGIYFLVGHALCKHSSPLISPLRSKVVFFI